MYLVIASALCVIRLLGSASSTARSVARAGCLYASRQGTFSKESTNATHTINFVRP